MYVLTGGIDPEFSRKGIHFIPVEEHIQNAQPNIELCVLSAWYSELEFVAGLMYERRVPYIVVNASSAIDRIYSFDQKLVYSKALVAVSITAPRHRILDAIEAMVDVDGSNIRAYAYRCLKVREVLSPWDLSNRE